MNPERIKIFHVTDVEGNWNYWQRYLSLAALDLPSTLPDDTYFVYGGDVFDKGDGDIRLAEALIDMKDRYPDRVFLLIGNRDLNKMKLTSELSDTDLARAVDKIPPPYWLEPNEAMTYKMYLSQRIAKESNYVKDPATNDFPEEAYQKFNTKINKLKWLLEYTMGCERTFENRRQELAALHSKPLSSVSDSDVLLNFIESVSSPSGFVRRYLDRAQLAVVLGNTLFVHGAVSEISLNFIPGPDNKDNRQTFAEVIGRELQESHSIQEWVFLLNQWCRENIEAWKRQPLWNADRSDRGGRPLMGYSYFPAMQDSTGRTVVITDFLPAGNPKPLSQRAIQLLKKSNIHRVVVGHRPFGDSPTIIRSFEDPMNQEGTDDIEVISADQSYSDVSSPDNRGAAVALLEIEGSLMSNRSRLKAILKDGDELDFVLPWRPNASPTKSSDVPEDDFIGKHTAVANPSELASCYWIKGKFKDGSYYLSRGQGRRVEYLRVPGDEVRRSFLIVGQDWTKYSYRK